MYVGVSNIDNPNSSDTTYNSMNKEEERKVNTEESVRTGGSTNEEDADPIIVSILADAVKEDTEKLNKSILATAEKLKELNNIPFDQLKLISELEEPLLSLLRNQSNLFTFNVKNRMS
jgi:hypothetical protein